MTARGPREGDVLEGRHRLDREIASTDVGAVFDAVELTTGRPVAVEIATDLEDERASSRWLRDAMIAQRLEGEHVVHVIETGTLPDGAPYVVREPILTTLAADLRARGPRPVEQAVAWTLEASEAIAEAHARGMAHGDVGPETVVLARGGGRVEDGGDADAPEAREVVKVLWTSAAKAERFAREDVRRDIRGLASLLRALAAGSAEVDAAPTLPNGLAHVVARAMSDEPSFANVGELARALAPYAPKGHPSARNIGILLSRSGVIGKAIPSSPAPEPWVAQSSTRRRAVAPRRSATTLAALALLGAALGGLIALWRTSSSPPEPTVSQTTLTSAETGTGEAAEEITREAVEDSSRAKYVPLLEAEP